MGGAIAVIAVVVVALIVVVLVLRKRRRFGSLPEEVRLATTQANAAQSTLRSTERGYRKRVKEASRTLKVEQDPRGRRLKASGGVVLYERWIKTPQGEGSLVGVKASAADDSSIRQRLTVTRMATLGVFSLAAPKGKGVGNAYVVIEGPSVSGVATFPAKNNKNAGRDAFAFAAAVNNAAREVALDEPRRPARIKAATAALAAAQDRTDVVSAQSAFETAVAALPAQHRARFDKSQPSLIEEPEDDEALEGGDLPELPAEAE